MKLLGWEGKKEKTENFVWEKREGLKPSNKIKEPSNWNELIPQLRSSLKDEENGQIKSIFEFRHE